MNRRRAPRPLAALALVVVAGLVAAGCGGSGDATADRRPATSSSSGSGATTSARSKAARFSQCMRDHGVADFPDPDASGELTIDAVANGTSVDTDSAAFGSAIAACKDLEPAGFTGRRRTPEQQRAALRFAQCMRDHGIADFPDPTPDGALIDTTRIPSAAGRGAKDIPGFEAATDACKDVLDAALGRQP